MFLLEPNRVLGRLLVKCSSQVKCRTVDAGRLRRSRNRLLRPDWQRGLQPISRELGRSVHGVDNNQRAAFFGPQGDTRWNQQRLRGSCRSYRHHELDIRDRGGVLELVATLRPSLIVHAAAQPSHDLAAAIPFDDFDTNAVGTLNVLEAARRSCPESAVRLPEHQQGVRRRTEPISWSRAATRWDYADPRFEHGIPETFSIDQSLHSLFGASKVAGRRDGAGVRPLFRHADLLPARRLPDRAQSQRRRAARLPQLPGAMQPRRPRIPDFRLQGQTGSRQHPQPRRRAIHSRVRRRAAQRRGLQSWRRQSQFLQHARSVRAGGAAHGQRRRYTYVETTGSAITSATTAI